VARGVAEGSGLAVAAAAVGDGPATLATGVGAADEPHAEAIKATANSGPVTEARGSGRKVIPRGA